MVTYDEFSFSYFLQNVKHYPIPLFGTRGITSGHSSLNLDLGAKPQTNNNETFFE